MQHLSPLNRFEIPADVQATVDDIMARNRALYGGWTMEGDGSDTGGDSGDDGKTGDSTDDKAAADDKAGGDAGDDKKTDDDKTSDDPWADPAKAKAEIERLRRENASSRTDAKKKAADDARAELAQSIGKAIGLIKDDDKTKVDPAELATKLTETTGAYSSLQREHQVLLSALDASADHKALLDSRTFLAKVAELDPSDEKFQSKVDAAVKTAVEQNPKLKAGQVSGSSAVDHPGGSGGGGTKPASLEEAVTKKMAG